MLTYEQVMKVDFTQLNTVADKWDEMAGEFKKLEGRYRDRIQNVSLDGTWTGQASLHSRPNFATTRHEYASAQVEAKAVASLLREAYAHFVDLKKKLEHARQEAIDAGMKVSEAGVASFDFSKVSAADANALRHDPDLRSTEAAWSQHINDAVTAVADADEGLKTALEAVVVDVDFSDGELNGFNGKASGDIEHYDAEAALDLAHQVNNGKKLSPEEMARFESLMRDNSHDKVFSQTLLAGLGPDGTIKFTKQINEWAYGSDKGRRDDYLALEKAMADSFAVATDVPGSVSKFPPGSPTYQKWVESKDGTFYRQFMDGLDKTGTHNYGDKLRPLHGYQVLATLMDHADAKYDDQFLYAVGDKMIDAEKKDPNVFKVWGADYKGIEPDPVDTLLNVMRQNPSAATAFLDPAGNGAGPDHIGNDHLKYLVGAGDGARHWPVHEIVGGHGTATFDNPHSRAGLGAALEAATTGHPPLHEGDRGGAPGPHTPAQARVMQNMLTTLDSGLGGEKIDPDMQKHVGRALADYVQDTHHILAESGSKYGSPDGLGTIWAQGDDAGITVGKGTLMRVMRGASSDSQTFSLLYDTQQQYSVDQLASAPHSSGEGHERWKNPASEMGSVMGAMNSIGSDVIFDERGGKIQAANDMARYAYHFAGAPVTGLPYLGDATQRLIDAGTYEWSKDVISTAQSKAQEMNTHQYSSGVTGTYTYIDQWAAAHHVDINDETNKKGDPAWDAWQAMRREAKQSYVASRADAAAYLGWE
ncbi:hypothetical protein ACGFRG_31175 [Streptomyces sp. NPDC048696]|uniref:hypothetical protein n=1 Tax=Streptomyces sp. NPDC048696 TaxID=3365585 RepID=UPI00371B0A04